MWVYLCMIFKANPARELVNALPKVRSCNIIVQCPSSFPFLLSCRQTYIYIYIYIYILLMLAQIFNICILLKRTGCWAYNQQGSAAKCDVKDHVKAEETKKCKHVRITYCSAIMVFFSLVPRLSKHGRERRGGKKWGQWTRAWYPLFAQALNFHTN